VANICIVPSYQPEVSLDIFTRAMFNKDIAQGVLDLSDDLATIGPSSVFHIKNEIPEIPTLMCYVLNAGTCTEEQWKLVANNSVVIEDYKVISYQWPHDGEFVEEKHQIQDEERQEILDEQRLEL
jgi:hypothetical protein